MLALTGPQKAGKLEADISPSPKPAEPKLPAEKMVVGGVGRAIVNPPTPA